MPTPAARSRRPLFAALTATMLVTACAAPAPPAATGTAPSSASAAPLSAPPTASGEPSAAPPASPDPSAPVAARVAELLARMTIEDKIGQMTQADRQFLLDDADIARYRLGSLLSGGGSTPDDNTPQSWADMYDGYQEHALSTPLGIPLIYGIDAVHGHNNVVGATIFPHNIGLGATRDPSLAERIGAATAVEVAGTGIDWTFGPCLCVARDERWGRTYESFGEDPTIAESMTTIIRGFQGDVLGGSPTSILATAKHFVGDGGTTGGIDQGDTQLTEDELRRLHLAPFVRAVEAGVGSVMVSFSSWNGDTLHGHRYLITDVLKGELGFTGFVISDWGGIDRIDGEDLFSAEDVAMAINAGIDMVMVPQDYIGFQAVLRGVIDSGEVPMGRIDDAVSRILTKKFELGLFERPLTDRNYTPMIGAAEHRALGREAVAHTLVVLKNDGEVLPLERNARILVTGRSADDIGLQSGGWTITWQGSAGDITEGTTILEGISEVAGPDATVVHEPDPDDADLSAFDVVVAVVGETPYAEFEGDRLDGLSLDPPDLVTLDKVAGTDVPLVVVLVTGRPLIITRQLPEWEAVVAAWLPGTEGAGVADVLFGDVSPTGTLPQSWPRSDDQLPINAGDSPYDPLFPFDFGLTY